MMRAWIICLTVLWSATAGAQTPREQAWSALAQAERNSAAEAAAMTAVAAFARDEPPNEAALAAAAQAVEANTAARTPAAFLAAANLFADAARAAPWVAEYHFQRGTLLAKAGAHVAAARALDLYLDLAPQARDRAEVQDLIAALKRAPAPAQHAPGEVFQDCADCPELVVIPSGTFTMGSPASEQGRYDAEGPPRSVAVATFALGKTNVTQQEFIAFLRETRYQPEPCDPLLHKVWKVSREGLVTPPGGADLPRQPAVCLNWQDAEAYVAWLNRHARDLTGAQARYRLPAEAEWEYAARGMTTTARWWGDAIGVNRANCNGCGSRWDNRLIAPTGSFGPNPFGLYDMLGNVWQWTADCWNESYAGAPPTGQAWTAGQCNSRVVRGGSWSNTPAFVRSAMRMRSGERGQDFDYAGYVGFRVARSLD